MTITGIGFDILMVALVSGLVWLERRRGGERALLSFGALVASLVLTDWLAPRVALAIGGGMLTVMACALVTMVLAILLADRLGRRMQKASSLPRAEGEPVRKLSGGIGALVGLTEGLILAVSLALLVGYLSITVPSLKSVDRGSFTVRLVDRYREPILGAIFRGEPAGVPEAPELPADPDDRSTSGSSEGIDSGSGSDQLTGGKDENRSIASTLEEDLAGIESLDAVLEDPELLEAIRQGNYGVILSHPGLVELWQDPRFRRVVTGADPQALAEESEKMERLADAYEDAFTAFAANDLPAALSAAEGVLAEDLDYGRILIWKGLFLKRSGQLAEARSTLEQASERYLDSGEPLYLLADMAADDGASEAAEALYTQAMERNPDFHYAVHNRGILRYEQGRYLDALADLRRSLEIHPDDAELASSCKHAFEMLVVKSMGEIKRTRTAADSWEPIREWHKKFAAVCHDEPLAQATLCFVTYIGVTELGHADYADEGILEIDRALEVAGEDQVLVRQLTSNRGCLLLRADRYGEAISVLQPLLEDGLLPLGYSAQVFTELAIFHARNDDLENGRRLAGVAAGILNGTSIDAEPFLALYRIHDPEGLPWGRGDLEDFLPGQRLTLKENPENIVYAEPEDESEAAPSLEQGDVLVEIEGVKPLWPSEIRELMIEAMKAPPVTLTLLRGEEQLEVAVQSGFGSLQWDIRRPLTIPDDLAGREKSPR